MLGWARECSDLKTIDGTEDVIVTIGQLVVEGGVLIDECMGHGFDVRAVSGALGDVGDRIQQCRQKMDEARQDLSMTLEILILRNVQNSITQGASKLQHEEKEANEKIVRKFMKHLEPVDVAKVRSDLKKAVLSDSGAWFLNMNVVQGWMSVGGHGNLDLDADGATVVSPSNSMLWCYGKPGSGKTILATVLVEEISKKYTDRAIISTTYFPLKFDIPSRRTTSSVANTVLHQLLTQLPDEERLELAKTINDSNILSLILSVTSKFKHCFLVLDALDECDDLGDLLDLIGKLRNSFRILIFSRDYRDIRTFLKRIGLDTEIGLDTLSSSSVERKSEIRIFVQAKLQEYQERQKLVIGDPSVVVEVMDALTDNAYGMWLWVVLQIETLCLQRTDSDIRAAIKDLPKDLDTTYLRALRRVEELGSRTSRKVQRALKWIVGAHRPLTVEEFAQAVAIAEVDSDDEPWVTYSKINDPRALVDDCANLCMVSLDWEGKSVVQFIHASVRDYLLASPSNFKESLPKYHIASLPDLHYELATSCVSYLKLVRYRDSRRTSVALFTSTGDVTGTISTFRYVTEQSGENLKKHLRMYLPVLLSSRPSIYDREIIDAMVRAYALAIDNASGLIPAEAVFSSSRLALTMEPPGHHLRHILLQNLAVTIHQLGPMEEKINCQSFHAAELIYQHILGQRPQELSCMEGLADIATDRFNFTGDVTFLDKSTKLLDDVLKLCHVDNYAQRSRVLDKLANTARDRSILGLSASGLTDTVHMYAEALRSAIDQNTRASCLADFTDTLIALSCFSDASLEEAVLTIREAMTGISFDEFRDFDRLVELFFKAASKETHPGYPISYTMTEVFLGRRRTYHNCALAALCLCHGSTDSHADIRLRVTHGRRLFMELQSMILSSQSQLGTDSTDGLQDKEYRYIGSGISVPMRQLRQRLDAAQHLYVVGLGVAMHTIAQGDTNLSLAILEASENPEWSDTTCLGALFSKTLPKVSLDVITSMANSKTSESDAARLQTLVQQIQALGVYEALLASTLSSLVQTAQHGHLVVLFRGESTCHAVLMRKGSQDISDPLLLGQSAYDSMAAWSRPEHDNQRDVIRLMPKYPDGKGTHISDQWALDALHNLWLHVVEPIFIFLKLSVCLVP
ncbi:hypothetical protein B0H13DRAFT_358533 [Mycena leptocephala]|nr:hypothetical protein B0H13DRAFT_358533 [Mycena leptocephala]